MGIARWLLAGWLGLMLPANSFAQTCVQEGWAGLSVTSQFADFTVDNSDHSDTLSRLSTHPLGAFDRTVGLTHIEFGQRYRVRVAGRDMGNGLGCYWLEEVEIEFGAFSILVQLARELAPGSCERRVTWEHEMTHVDIAREVFARWLPTVRDAARRAVDGILPIVSQEPQQVPDEFIAEIGRRLDDTFAALGADLAQRQMAIDTAAEYERLSAACR